MVRIDKNGETDGPRRGEIWLTRFGAAGDGEPGKTRPAVVLLVDEFAPYGETSLIPVVPLSASLSVRPDRIEVPVSAGLERPTVAVTRGIRGMSRSRLLRRIGILDNATMEKITFATGRILGVTL